MVRNRKIACQPEFGRPESSWENKSMWVDLVVEEVREAHTTKSNYDL